MLCLADKKIVATRRTSVIPLFPFSPLLRQLSWFLTAKTSFLHFWCSTEGPSHWQQNNFKVSITCNVWGLSEDLFVPPAKSFRRNYKKEYSLSILKYLYCRFPAAQLFSIIRSLTSCTCLVIKRWLKKQLNIKTLTNFRSKSFRLKQPIICDLNHALSSGSREIRRSQQWTKGSCQRESTVHRCPPSLSPCSSDYQLFCFAF